VANLGVLAMAKRNEKTEKPKKEREKEKAKRGSKERFEFIVQQLEDISLAVRNLNSELGSVRSELRRMTKDHRDLLGAVAKKTVAKR
jgi:chromosome segregation ATPase